VLPTRGVNFYVNGAALNILGSRYMKCKIVDTSTVNTKGSSVMYGEWTNIHFDASEPYSEETNS
jgi:hypothetical protein